MYRTRLSLLLLAIGIIASLLPGAGIVGDGLFLGGGLLLIVSSRPFGRAHRRNAIVGTALGFGAAAANALSSLFVTLNLPLAPTNTADLASWIQSVQAAVSLALLLGIALGGLSALGLVLVTYSLQDRRGRVFLWVALGLVIGLGLAGYAIVIAAFGTLLNGAVSGSGLNPTVLSGILFDLNGLVYLQLVPLGLFAACYFLADLRIRSGLLPVTSASSSDA